MIGGGGNIQERKIQPQGWDDICEAKQQGHRGVCTKQWTFHRCAVIILFLVSLLLNVSWLLTHTTSGSSECTT